ncbi:MULTISPECIES: hypothetical protein [Gordonia]|uniref:hypothetical protein n=1 Tax=Gordonia aichiensis TaxID=36820 RepID=UPI0012FB7E90|nr:hypothetical protein [Gordonia aichiensis]
MDVRDAVAEIVPAADELRTLRDLCTRSISTREMLAGKVQQIIEGVEGISPDTVDVLACGSLARQEHSDASDVDYLIVSSSLRFAALRDAGHQIHRLVAELDGKPGASGIFGQAVGMFDLIERVGLQDDTNISHTRRMEILLESVSLTGGDIRSQIVRAIIDRYTTSRSSMGPPRFLINDVLRYWRTITVDFQAKRDGSHDQQKMILRYLKLRITRKILLASSVLPLITVSPSSNDRDTYINELAALFDDPPLCRLIATTTRLDDADAVENTRVVCRVLNDFLAATGSKEQRQRFDGIDWDDREQDADYMALKASADELDDALAAIFTSPNVIEATKSYMLF